MADWELRTIHPLYGVAWLGLGLALSLVAEATQRGIRAWTLRSWGLALPLGKTSQESRPPEAWRAWGYGGAAAVLGFYLIESFPNGMADWELRTIHPLYGVDV